jgi:hypothetical protein
MQAMATRKGRTWIKRLFAVGALTLLAMTLAAAQTGSAWRDNLNREQVVEAMGPPKSTVKMGAREFLVYDGGVRIELQSGLVTNISGPVPKALLAGTVAPPALPPAATPKPANTTVATAAQTTAGNATAAVAKPPVLAPTVAPPKPASQAPVTVALAPAPAAKPQGPATAGGAALAKTQVVVTAAGKTDANGDDAMVNEAANPTLPPEAVKLATEAGVPLSGNMSIAGMGKIVAPPAPPPPNPWVVFGVGLAMSTMFLAAMLKLSFVRKDFPVIWRDIFLVAFLTALFYQGLNSLLANNGVFQIVHMLQGDWIPTAGLMLFLILKCTEVKNFATATRIMLAGIGVTMALQFVAQMFLPSFG